MTGRKPAPDKAALALLDPDGTFLDRLRQDRVTLRALLEILRDEGEERKAALAALELLAHRLAGAAGIFGHDVVGDAAMDLEDCLTAVAGMIPGRLIDVIVGKAEHLDALLGEAAGEE